MMRTPLRYAGSLAVFALGACASMQPSTPQEKMTFFVTSVNPGKGADLGGLAGADAHCQALASAVGAGKRTWHAYLATTSNGQPAVNARQGHWRGDCRARRDGVDDTCIRCRGGGFDTTAAAAAAFDRGVRLQPGPLH